MSLALLLFAGCSNGPTPPRRFKIDPEQAAQEAMKLYDTNGDGKLDAKELAASPPLVELLKNLKARSPDHPDFLTEADIAGRLRECAAVVRHSCLERQGSTSKESHWKGLRSPSSRNHSSATRSTFTRGRPMPPASQS